MHASPYSAGDKEGARQVSVLKELEVQTGNRREESKRAM